MTSAYRVSRRFLPLASAILLLAASALPASASEFFVCTNKANSELYRVETSTGGSTLVGLTGVAFLTDIAFSPAGVLYATDGSTLYTLNVSTGAGTSVGSINAGFVVGLDFDDSGTLWGVDTATNDVLTINTSTGNGTVDFSTSIVFNGDIAHHTGDIFYASAQFLSERNLFEVDVNTMSGTDRGLIFSGSFPLGMDFDANDDLFVFMSNGDIYQIPNFATSGAATFVNSTTITSPSGAAFQTPAASPVPGLPGAWKLVLLLSLSGLLVAAYLRSREPRGIEVRRG